MDLRTNIIGSSLFASISMSLETCVIENDASASVEGFLFAVAAVHIPGESWRSGSQKKKQKLYHVDDRWRSWRGRWTG